MQRVVARNRLDKIRERLRSNVEQLRKLPTHYRTGKQQDAIEELDYDLEALRTCEIALETLGD